MGISGLAGRLDRHAGRTFLGRGHGRSSLRAVLVPALAVVGWIVALYHSLLYWGVIPKDLVPCGEGASCTDVKAVLFGFVPVPLLSIAAFSLVVVILSIVKKGSRNE